MAQIGYIESILGNVQDVATRLAIRRVAEELLGRIAQLEAAVGTGGSGPLPPTGPTEPLAHHATHEPGGTDVLANNAWTNTANVFTADQMIDKLRPELAVRFPGETAKGRVGNVIAHGGRLDLTSNLYFDGANWNHDDPAHVGLQIVLSPVNQQIIFRTAPAGANPTIVTSVAWFNMAGDLVNSGSLFPNQNVVPIGFIFPGRVDVTSSQGSWYLGSHGSYGLWTNTGLYLTGQLYGVPWTAYTPVWTTTGTAPAIGNGSLTGRYIRLGAMCFFRIKLIAGSTTTYGTGQWRFSFPLTFSGQGGASILGQSVDSSAGAVYSAMARQDNASSFGVMYQPVAAALGLWTGSTPFVWAVNDDLNFSGCYEIG